MHGPSETAELRLAVLEPREDARFAAPSFATLSAGIFVASFAAALLLMRFFVRRFAR